MVEEKSKSKSLVETFHAKPKKKGLKQFCPQVLKPCRGCR